jgi:hypothetical protein
MLMFWARCVRGCRKSIKIILPAGLTLTRVRYGASDECLRMGTLSCKLSCTGCSTRWLTSLGEKHSEEQMYLFTDRCSGFAQDTSWINVYLPETPYVVYEVDEPYLTDDLQYKSLVNKGMEAMAYLQFIIDF